MTGRGRIAATTVGLLAALAGPAIGAGATPARAPLTPPPQIGADAPARGFPAAPSVTADAYLLLDLDTGQVLAERRADERRPAASAVKVLTALTVLQRAHLDQRVTVGEEVDGFAADAAGVGLDPGDSWSVADLLAALVARSGNDAAAALAVAVGGSVPGFVNLMQQDAAALGIDGAVIESPDGLADGNRLSARDLAVLSRAALADPAFAAIARRATVDLPGLGTVASRNELLARYPGAFGVKTGYTAAAGRCLIAAAARDRRLLVVVLGSDGPTDHFTDAQALLDHGFTAFAPVPVADDRPEVELLTPGEWLPADAPPAQLLVPAAQPAVDRSVQLPVEADGEVAPLVVTWRGATLGSIPLTGPSPRPPPAEADGARIGWWLADRTYAALRATLAERGG